MRLTQLLRSALPAARRGRVLTILTAGAIAVGPGVSTAQAQPWKVEFWKNLGVSASVGRVQPVDGTLDPVVKVGFSAGFVPKEGWGTAFGLGWFRTDVSSGGLAVGQLNAKPVMAGVGRTWVRGRLATNASMTAGIIFNKVSLNRALLDQIEGPASLKVHNSFAVRPALGLEYSLFRKLSVKGALSYLATRPAVFVTTSQGEMRRTWNASNGSFQLGVVFYPFR